MRHLFRVALVHLAAVGLDEEFRHEWARIIHGRAAFATGRLSTFHLVDLSDLIAARMKNERPAIGVIGGRGLYQMNELRGATERTVAPPFGAPSDTPLGGQHGGR